MKAPNYISLDIDTTQQPQVCFNCPKCKESDMWTLIDHDRGNGEGYTESTYACDNCNAVATIILRAELVKVQTWEEYDTIPEVAQ